MNRRLHGFALLALAISLLAGALVPGTSAEAVPPGDPSVPIAETVPADEPADGPGDDGSIGSDETLIPGSEPQDGSEPVPVPSPSDEGAPGTSEPSVSDEPAEAEHPSVEEELVPLTDEERAIASEKRAAELAAQHGALTSRSGLSSGFKAGYIISDSNFYNGNAMSAAQIQTFLEQRVPRCTLGDPGREKGKPWGNTTLAWGCLKDAIWDTTPLTRGANAYCGAYQGVRAESSASVIAKVSKACGISPRVLLVMLEKEQSLITDTWPTINQFNRAMGYDCPDSGPNNSANCNPSNSGFVHQVYRSAWQMKVYRAHPQNYRYQPFQTNTIQWHPNLGCGTSRVYIENRATAALYIYTPYRPNAASLAAGWGEGDACSSYGNRNFYQLYKQWFGSPNTFFPDVPQSHQFFTEIEWMGTSGLSTGTKTEDGRASLYLPKEQVSREAMAAFLFRLSGANYVPPSVSPFADVKPGDKFYKEIAWMHARGLSTGNYVPGGKPKFSPKESVSREAMAAFLYRYQNAEYAAPSVSPFADMKPGDKFYKEITWMSASKISTGNKQPTGKPKYLPKDRVSREAMAAFIYRMSH